MLGDMGRPCANIDRVLSKCTPINLDLSLKKCNFFQEELLALGHKFSGLNLDIDQNKVVAVLQKPVPRNSKEMQSFLRFSSYYRNHSKTFAHITSRLGASLHQRQILDGEPRIGLICYIFRKEKYLEDRYGETQTYRLFLVLALENLHYYLEGVVFEVYTDFTALKPLLNMKTINRHMLRLQIAIQEYRGNINIIYKEGKIHTNSDGLRRWPLDNVKSNPDYEVEVAAKITIHFMEIDRRKNFKFAE
ncbi:hypothetical protein O181_060908 [Austropuccinia psidii MF-1]|uniref:Reverse transcriptase RNase H-like domain-containing protein n=1 Tax=Austropuccinia psidii MF-1 TaxID=1389203 RepID=A0A9Q3EH80_9BASI|nr:hypothetical protein [Austropuccinia psidii MF-1]